MLSLLSIDDVYVNRIKFGCKTAVVLLINLLIG